MTRFPISPERIEELVEESGFQQADRLIHALIVLGANGHPGWKRAVFHSVARDSARIGIARALTATPELSDEGALAAGESAARGALAIVAANYVQRSEFPDETVLEIVGPELTKALLGRASTGVQETRERLDAGAWEAVLLAHPGGTPNRATITTFLRGVLARQLLGATDSPAENYSPETSPGRTASAAAADSPRTDTVGHWKLRTVRDLVGDPFQTSAPAGYRHGNSDPTGGPTVPIERLGLSVRTSNALLRSGARTLDDLARLTPRELLAIPNFGTKAHQEVARKLRQHGLASPPARHPASDLEAAKRRSPDPREAEMVKLRKAGLSLAQIAGKFGISRARVGQITLRSTTSGEFSDQRRAAQLAAAQAVERNSVRASGRAAPPASWLARSDWRPRPPSWFLSPPSLR